MKIKLSKVNGPLFMIKLWILSLKMGKGSSQILDIMWSLKSLKTQLNKQRSKDYPLSVRLNQETMISLTHNATRQWLVLFSKLDQIHQVFKITKSHASRALKSNITILKKLKHSTLEKWNTIKLLSKKTFKP